MVQHLYNVWISYAVQIYFVMTVSHHRSKTIIQWYTEMNTNSKRNTMIITVNFSYIKFCVRHKRCWYTNEWTIKRIKKITRENKWFFQWNEGKVSTFVLRCQNVLNVSFIVITDMFVLFLPDLQHFLFFLIEPYSNFEFIQLFLNQTHLLFYIDDFNKERYKDRYFPTLKKTQKNLKRYGQIW